MPPAIALLLVGCASPAPGPPTPEAATSRALTPAGSLAAAAESPASGFFSSAQAERGRVSFGTACKECHPPSQFRGSDFEWRWRRQTAWELFEEISTRMPETEPGALPTATYADIVAYLLSLNDYQSGDRDLVPTRDALAEIPLGAGVEKSSSEE